MIGNHELYNFPRDTLSACGLFTAPAQRDSPTTYLSFQDLSAPTLRFVILDPFEISVVRTKKSIECVMMFPTLHVHVPV